MLYSHKFTKVREGYYWGLTGANPQSLMENVSGEFEWVTLLTFNHYCQGGFQHSVNIQLL